jgi:hypothetical protein
MTTVLVTMGVLLMLTRLAILWAEQPHAGQNDSYKSL